MKIFYNENFLIYDNVGIYDALRVGINIRLTIIP